MGVDIASRVEAFLNYGGIILLILVMYSPTWIILQRIPTKEKKQFFLSHPQKRDQINSYRILWLMVAIGSTLFAIIVSLFIHIRLIPFVFFSIIGTSIAIFIGFFEVATGISPILAPNFRWSRREYYASHPLVLYAGWMRIIFGTGLTVFCIWINSTFPA